ncbi:hypothetical protein KC359_g230 [Hortaea werneckii]|nr:hypothetical protein KC359_g230 [Hortaea werneckii]
MLDAISTANLRKQWEIAEGRRLLRSLSAIVLESLTGILESLPLSCIWLNPVMFDPSLANPPWSSPLTSATALAIPKGSVAPGKTCPPSTVPMSGFTKFRMSAPLWHSASSVSAKTVRTFVILVMVELAGTKKRCS